jgi:hypothetical protein
VPSRTVTTYEQLLQHGQELMASPFFAGLKIEFEAEGASFRDVVALRLVASTLGTQLTLKLSGGEALRDINDCFDLRPDRIVAPMVESSFAVGKYLDASERLLCSLEVQRGINVETVTCVKALPEILREHGHRLDFVTIGRSDMSASLGLPPNAQDSDAALGVVDEALAVLRPFPVSIGLGGRLTVASLQAIASRGLLEKLDFVETRRVVMRTSVRPASGSDLSRTIDRALRFEYFFLRMRKEVSEELRQDDLTRLTEIEMRLS